MLAKVLTYVCLGLVGACLFLGTMWKIEEWRGDLARAELQAFVAQVQAEGEAAERGRKTRELREAGKKKEADRLAGVELARLESDNRRLRNERARRSVVPQAAPNAQRPDRICFIRSELERALREFEAGVGTLLEEGDECRVKLDNAKQWADSLQQQ